MCVLFRNKYWVKWSQQKDAKAFTSEALWGNDYGLSDKPSWGWWLNNPVDRSMWNMVELVQSTDDRQIPQPQGPKPVWMQSPAGIWGWTVWQPSWFYRKTKDIRMPWVHFVYCEGREGTSVLARPGIEDVHIYNLWQVTEGWRGIVGKIQDDLAQPQCGSQLPQVVGGPAIMTCDANRMRELGGERTKELLIPNKWALNGKQPRGPFMRKGCEVTNWRPGRGGQNNRDMTTVTVKGEVEHNPMIPKTDNGKKSQLAWQIMNRMGAAKMLSITEIVDKGFTVPNFDNLRVRLDRNKGRAGELNQLKEEERAAIESLEQSSGLDEKYTLMK